MDVKKTSQVVKSLFSRYESSKGGQLTSNAAPEKYKQTNMYKWFDRISTNEHGNIFLAPCLQRVAKYMNVTT
jgi:hypothetical protein